MSSNNHRQLITNIRGHLSMPSTDTICIVIPCYNEELRLDTDTFKNFSSMHDNIAFIFVDDGSNDGTPELLSKLCGNNNDKLNLIALDKNSGKAAAVRDGVLSTIDKGYDFIGYWDADLSTPLEEILRLHREFDNNALDIVIGSRVKMLGHTIERRLIRHLVGRLFATATSMTLKIPVYDTQCGAKLFRNNEKLRLAFREDWMSNWAFDVELLHRYLLMASNTDDLAFIKEVPLLNWKDVSGSKVKAVDLFISLYELIRLYRFYNNTDARKLYQ